MEKKPTIEILPKTPILGIIEQLRFYRNKFKDDIPKEIVHSFSPDRNYKVRKGWWQGVYGEFEFMLKYLDQQNNEELITDINQFLHDYEGKQGFIDRLTTEKDIQKANNLIDRAINALENLQNSV